VLRVRSAAAMCPACISLTAIVLTAAGAGSAGGLTAWAVKRLRAPSAAPKSTDRKEKPR
jgi:hypothetical protein